MSDKRNEIAASFASDLTTSVLSWRAEAKRLLKECEALLEAVAFYADPTLYHGITIRADRPTGGFDEDVSMTPEYDYPKPGKHARETLVRVAAMRTDVDGTAPTPSGNSTPLPNESDRRAP